MTIGARPVPNGSPGNTADAGSWKRATSSTASDPLGGRVASLYPRTRVPRISVPTRQGRLRILKWLTVLVPAVCAGIYETVRHSFLTTDLPNSLGTLIAVLLVVAISFGFARISFGIIQKMEEGLIERNRRLQELSRDAQRVAVLEERDRLAREMHDGIAQVLAYLLVRLETTDTGHVDIHQHKIRDQCTRKFQSLLTGRRFADHLEVIFVREEAAHAIAEQGVIINK